MYEEGEGVDGALDSGFDGGGDGFGIIEEFLDARGGGLEELELGTGFGTEVAADEVEDLGYGLEVASAGGGGCRAIFFCAVEFVVASECGEFVADIADKICVDAVDGLQPFCLAVGLESKGGGRVGEGGCGPAGERAMPSWTRWRLCMSVDVRKGGR